MQVRPETAEPMRRVLEKMLRVRLSALPDEVGEGQIGDDRFLLPDLLRRMTLWNPDAGWVRAVHQGLVELNGSVRIRLLACEYEPGDDGFLCIAATSPGVASEVVPGDRVQAGVAVLRDGDRPLRISQRIFRTVCHNGSITSLSEGEVSNAGSDVRAAVVRCFDRAEFQRELEVLREAARTEIQDPLLWQDEMEYLRDDPAGREALGRLYARRVAGAPTLWDLVNEVTSAAREVEDWSRRLDLEEEAGRLARLRPPRPGRTPASTLELVES
jgi:hypothetical protein